MNNDLPYAPTNDVIFKALFSHHTDPDLLLLKDFLFALTGIYPDTILYEDREINTDTLTRKIYVLISEYLLMAKSIPT